MAEGLKASNQKNKDIKPPQKAAKGDALTYKKTTMAG